MSLRIYSSNHSSMMFSCRNILKRLHFTHLFIQSRNRNIIEKFTLLLPLKVITTFRLFIVYTQCGLFVKFSRHAVKISKLHLWILNHNFLSHRRCKYGSWAEGERSCLSTSSRREWNFKSKMLQAMTFNFSRLSRRVESDWMQQKRGMTGITITIGERRLFN